MCRRFGKTDRVSSEDEINNDNNKVDLYDKEIEKIMNNFEGVGKNVASIASSFFNLTAQSLQNFQEKANEISTEVLKDGNFDQIQSQVKGIFGDEEDGFRVTDKNDKGGVSKEIDVYFPRPYQDRDPVTLINKHLKGFFDGDSQGSITPSFGFGDFFGPSWKRGRTPFGYYSLKNPNERSYRDCMAKDGQSVWDSNGYWRCLFPNAVVPPDYLKLKNEQYSEEILTKDDYLDAINANGIDPNSSKVDLGTKGLFFNQFTDYLNWKNEMYKNIKRERQCSRRQKIIEKDLNLPIELNKQEQQQLSESIDNKKVVSYSVQSSYQSDNETNSIVLNETREEYYDDGTSSTKTITKSKPFDAKDWTSIVEKVNGVEEKHQTSVEPNGWFWKNEK
ncbi:hypothetical protein CAAN1_04S07206 [[Candida] anglica]|uniref:Uncharacterized protein n=1 Tax=[Candida] anglica TaxID=148631 RepID=A0ABP0E8V0_9ASCO